MSPWSSTDSANPRLGCHLPALATKPDREDFRCTVSLSAASAWGFVVSHQTVALSQHHLFIWKLITKPIPGRCLSIRCLSLLNWGIGFSLLLFSTALASYNGAISSPLNVHGPPDGSCSGLHCWNFQAYWFHKTTPYWAVDPTHSYSSQRWQAPISCLTTWRISILLWGRPQLWFVFFHIRRVRCFIEEQRLCLCSWMIRLVLNDGLNVCGFELVLLLMVISISPAHLIIIIGTSCMMGCISRARGGNWWQTVERDLQENTSEDVPKLCQSFGKVGS